MRPIDPISVAAADWSDYQVGRRIKLRDLAVLSAVVQTGSMAKAAARLSLTQPAVSQSIAELESVTGVRLLERSSRGVSATPSGAALTARGAEALDAIRQSLRDLQSIADPCSGEVWVGASESYVAGGMLAATIREMGKAYPRIAVHVIEANTAARRFDELRNRSVDVMLGRLSGTVADADLIEAPLTSEPILVAAGLSNPLTRRRRLKLADLAQEDWILAPPNTVVNDLVAHSFRDAGLDPPRQSVTTYSMQLRMQLLSTGRYLSALPESAVRFNASRWSIRALPVKLGSSLPVSVVMLRHRTLTTAARLFVDQIKAIYARQRA